jgi:hypothetical protein
VVERTTEDVITAILSILDSNLDPRLKCDTIRVYLETVVTRA